MTPEFFCLLLAVMAGGVAIGCRVGSASPDAGLARCAAGRLARIEELEEQVAELRRRGSRTVAAGDVGWIRVARVEGRVEVRARCGDELHTLKMPAATALKLIELLRWAAEEAEEAEETADVPA